MSDLGSSTPTFSLPSDHSSWGDEKGVPGCRSIRLISICTTYMNYGCDPYKLFSKLRMNPNKAGLWTANAYEGEHTREGCIFLFSPLEIAAIWLMNFLLAC